MSSTMRTPSRWKEWIPLATQQQRLRNLIQIMAYNMQHDDTVSKDDQECLLKYSYYYTLHASTMSSPFYMSEKLESEHPKWKELELSKEYGTYTGVVIRLWQHDVKSHLDNVICVTGVYFSGLVYIGPKLLQTDPASFKGNTIIYYMHGGYFTSPNSFLNAQPECAKITNISLTYKEVRPSYTIPMLSKLHTFQLEIKLESKECDILRQKISLGGEPDKSFNRTSATLRKLLSRNKPKTPIEHLTNVKKLIEDAKCRVQLLKQEKIRKESEIKNLCVTRDDKRELVQDLGCDLMNKYRTLSKDIVRLKERKKSNAETKQYVMNVTAHLLLRRRQLISDLSDIYPIVEVSPNKYEICNVYLPNAENFADTNDVCISVALGLVTQLVQIISTFLDIPLRYSVVQFSSRSKIIDHITVDIPDSEREFALFPRGSNYKLQFNYGVYLLNKNIAQLRWDCGLSTSDLRATLPNLFTLLNQKKLSDISSRHRSLSGSTLVESSTPPTRTNQESSSLGSSPKYTNISNIQKNMSEPLIIHSTSKTKTQNASQPNSHDSGTHLETNQFIEQWTTNKVVNFET